MPRAATGHIEFQDWADGETVSWRLRIRANGARHRIKLGTNAEGWNRERAQVALDQITEQIARGTWRPDAPVKRSAAVQPDETIHASLSRWWQGKQGELAENTRADYRWRLDLLLSFRPTTPTVEVDVRWVDDLRAHLAALKIENRKGKTLSPRSVNMALDLLAQALDLAVDEKLIEANPARGKRRRMKVAKPKRTYLQPDMVVDLLDAAGQWESELPEHQRYGRRALLALLCLAGPRIGEAIAADRGDFDLKLARWRIPDSKTAAGVRDVELPAFLVSELTAHVAAMKALGHSVGQTSPMFPTRNGGRHNASNVRNRLIAGTVERADAIRANRSGAMSLPDGITPHSLRRTFASLAVAAGRDPVFVMSQIGHTDARLTLTLYAQMIQRQSIDRALVWRLMRFAAEPKSPAAGPSFGPLIGPLDRSGTSTTTRRGGRSRSHSAA